MSWFSDLAGRADNILNNLDQSTASALNESGFHASPAPKNVTNHNLRPSSSQPSLISTTPTVNTGLNQETNSKYLSQISAPKVIRSSAKTTVPSANKRQKEDKLFEFLNSNDTDVKSNAATLNDRRHSSNSSNNNSRSTSPSPFKNGKDNSRRTSQEDNNNVAVNTNTKVNASNGLATGKNAYNLETLHMIL